MTQDSSSHSSLQLQPLRHVRLCNYITIKNNHKTTLILLLATRGKQGYVVAVECSHLDIQRNIRSFAVFFTAFTYVF